MATNEKTREPGGREGVASPTPGGAAWSRPGGECLANLDPKGEEPMTRPESPGPSCPAGVPEHAADAKLPPQMRKLLASTAEKDWPRIRASLVQSEEAGELLDLLPELNRVMKRCPARLMGRLGRQELTAEEVDRAYTQLHDSLHGVRQALHGLLHLAGFVDVRPPADPDPEAGVGPAGPEPRTWPRAAKPGPALSPDL